MPAGRLLAYYGDDFTGSTDALEVLAFAGMRTALLLKPPTPEVLARFGRAVSEAEDLAVLKTACLMLADSNEGKRIERLNFLLVSAGAAIAFGLFSALVSLRLLFLLKRRPSGVQPE